MAKKVYRTNAALGYDQYAYLVKLNKSKRGFDYLCINLKNIEDGEIYVIGEVVKDLEDFYVEETSLDVDSSPLSGTFLFDFFIKNYKGFEK